MVTGSDHLLTRVAAVFETYYLSELLLSGRVFPLVLMPKWFQTLTWYFPFRWSFSFPIVALTGPIREPRSLHRPGHAGGMDPVQHRRVVAGVAAQAVVDSARSVVDVAPDPHRAGRFRLAGTLLRIGAMNEMQYRINFFLQLLQSMLTVGTGLVILAVVFSKTDELGGWSRPQLLAVMGVFTLVGGVIRTFIQPNMQRVVNDVREGKLDHAGRQPSGRSIVGQRPRGAVLAVDRCAGRLDRADRPLVQLTRRFRWQDVVAFVVLLLSGLISIYCFWLMLASASFWLVRINEVQELFDGLFSRVNIPSGSIRAGFATG